MRRAQLGENRRESAARIEHIVEEQDDAEHHHDCTAGICQCNGTESADRCIDNNDDAEQHQPQLVAIARNSGKELRPADELRDHRGGKEDDNHKRGNRRERVRLIAVADDVDNGDGVDAPRKPRNRLAEDAEHEENRHRLNDRHVDPAEADLVRHPGTADKGADGAVRRDHRHREHERSERLPPHEVAREEAARTFMSPHIDAEREHKDHKKEQRQQHIERIHRCAPSPCDSKGTSSAVRAR